MLEDLAACHLYADGFQVETPSHELTPGTSHFEWSASAPSAFRGADYPSGPSASAHDSLISTCKNVKTDPAQATAQDTLTLGRRPSASKSAESSHYHPYTRTVKMTEHEQVIQFDNSYGTVPAESSRKSTRRSKESKRCYCTYSCPIKNKRCDGSVSREADMSRHINKHKQEEEELIASGLLRPENATDFGDLKPTGASICKGCGIPMSRKDAHVR
jgi:hypothetical protein